MAATIMKSTSSLNRMAQPLKPKPGGASEAPGGIAGAPKTPTTGGQK